jgi:hypothetical protein
MPGFLFKKCADYVFIESYKKANLTQNWNHIYYSTSFEKLGKNMEELNDVAPDFSSVLMCIGFLHLSKIFDKCSRQLRSYGFSLCQIVFVLLTIICKLDSMMSDYIISIGCVLR